VPGCFHRRRAPPTLAASAHAHAIRR
jgi:hypothetical protein